MNNKILIGVVIVVVIIAAVFVLKKSMTVPATIPSGSTQTPTTQSTQQTAVENTVTLSSDGFSPSNLTVKAGAKVTWINKSGASATVNSNPHPVHTDYPPLNLGSFEDGQSLNLTFDKAGTYGYHNHLNPSQGGTITVE